MKKGPSGYKKALNTCKKVLNAIVDDLPGLFCWTGWATTWALLYTQNSLADVPDFILGCLVLFSFYGVFLGGITLILKQ